MGQQMDIDGNIIQPSSEKLLLSTQQLKQQMDENGNIIRNSQPIQQQPQTKIQPGFASPLSLSDRIKRAMNAYQGGNEKVSPQEATSFLPMLGSILAPESLPLQMLGAGAGSLLRQGIDEKLSGENPPLTDLSSLGHLSGDIMQQAVLPRMLGGLMQPRTTIANLLANKYTQKVFPNIKNTVAGVQARNLQFPETGILETAAHNTDQATNDFVDRFNKADTPKEQNQIWSQYQNQIGTNDVAQSLNRLNRDVESGGSVANQQRYKSITSNVLSDVSRVRNLKMLPGGESAARQLAQNDVLQGAFKTKGEFDPETALKNLNGSKKEIYQEAMGPSYDSLKELAEAAPDATQGKVISYVKRHLMWTAGGALLGHGIGHEAAIGGAGLITYVAGKAVINKTLEDPAMVKLVIRAMKTPLTAPEAPFLQKALINGLRGIEAYSQTPDGDEKVTVGEDGKPILKK